jgi:predicted glycosyltransferase
MISMLVDSLVAQESPAMSASEQTANGAAHKKIWIDLDNSPHVPFFLPIMEELRKRGYEVFVTARNSYQVCELLELYNLRCEVIGGHWGKNRMLKILGTCARTVRLLPMMARQKPDLAISHGSRAQMLASYLLKIPTIAMYDYEFTQKMEFLHSLWFMVPEYLPDPADLEVKARTRTYPGLKEDVYVPSFRPDSSLRDKLGIRGDHIFITVRPPATEAHYHNPEAEALLEAAMNFFMERAETRVVLLPRNGRQAAALRKTWGTWISSGRILIPEHAVDGLNLVWASDLVVSGGGTMNREAAALGVPVYTIFRGQIGAVDRYLVQQGRLTLIENVDDVRAKIVLAPRDRSAKHDSGDRPALQVIVNNIISILSLPSREQSQDPA